MKIIKKAFIWLGIIWSAIAGSPVFWQNLNMTQKELAEWMTTDKPEHGTIINMDIQDIIKIYWWEKWLELVANHMIWEINKFREEDGKDTLQLDQNLGDFTQKWTKYISDNHGTDQSLKKSLHLQWSLVLWKRLKKDNIPFIICAENIWKWQKNIRQILDDWMEKSQAHRESILNPKFKKIGIWYYGDIWIITFTD